MKTILSFFSVFLFLCACSPDMVEPERNIHGQVIYDSYGRIQYKMTDKHPCQKFKNKMAALYEKGCGRKPENYSSEKSSLRGFVTTVRQNR